MKIVFVDTTIGGELIGGAQLFLPPLLRGLATRGHLVSLVTDGEPNQKVKDAINTPGIRVISDAWYWTGLVDDNVARWVNIINRENPDAFVISVSADLGWVVLPHLDPRIATLMIGHSNARAFYDPLKHYRDFVTKAVGVSEEICRQYSEYCGVPRKQIDWIPYGVVPNPMSPEETERGETLRLVYVGRLAEPDKKVSDLIKIVQSLRRGDVRYSLDVIGDGPMMPRFRSELAMEIERSIVRLRGWIENVQLLELLRAGQVSLLVSESEGFCIALVEEMANGCCPIVTDIESGNKQLVENGVNGFVVPVGDVEGFVDRIKLLAADRGRLNEMRRAAWYTGKQYSVERMLDNYVSCFERAVEDARSNPRTPDPNFPLMESCRSKYPLWLRRLRARAKRITVG